MVGILPLPFSLNFKPLGRLKKHKVLKLNDMHQLPVCNDLVVKKVSTIKNIELLPFGFTYINTM
jgi:hypothetical protein